jgi:hypothetical protein
MIKSCAVEKITSQMFFVSGPISLALSHVSLVTGACQIVMFEAMF